MKCDNCMHKQVCKYRPPKSYPQFMIDIMTDKCEHYIHAAYVQPVVHARWILYGRDSANTRFIHCSRCNFEVAIHGYREDEYYIYCPNCRAKMDGGEE